MMTNEEHHAHPAIGSSGLRLIGRSPLHYIANKSAPRKEAPAMAFGTAVHCAFLEPEAFNSRYAIVPAGIDKRTKDGKAYHASIEADGLIPLGEDDAREIASMVGMVNALPVTNLPRVCEQSIIWTDSQGIQCKARPDAYIAPCADFPNGIILDLKTCRDASPDAFVRDQWGYGCHIQAALYTEGILMTTGTLPEFGWLAVESESPYAAAFYTAPQELLDYGRAEVQRIKEIYADCLANDEWPAYGVKPQLMPLAGYMLKAMQDDEVSVEIRHV